MQEYIINPCSGMRIEVEKGQLIEVIDMEGDVVKVKEFPRNAIGTWLFPEKEDVTVQDPKTAHKMFK